MSSIAAVEKRYFDFSQEQKLAWLRLYRSENVGPVTFRDLISHFGTAEAALDALPELAKRGGAPSRIRICAKSDAVREMETLDQIGGEFICMGEQSYPSLLRQLEQSPPIVAVRGNKKIFANPALAIVGSRNASISGLKLAERFAREVANSGFTVVSGLARGIDTAAHKATLEPGTIAVMAGGMDCIFPHENKPLAEEIVNAGGALVTEMPIAWKPRAQDFPRRNRIISGIAQATLVVEAAQRSGSLITARLANEAGRIVLAVPGSPLDPRSAGTNNLIREGATLITSIDDIVEALRPISSEQEEFLFDISEPKEDESAWESEGFPVSVKPNDELRDQIISALSPTPVEVDDIVRFTDAEIGQVQLVLLELSLAGRLHRHTGNKVSLT